MLEQVKTVVLFLLFFIIGLAIYQYINVWGDLEEKLRAANQEKQTLQESREALQLNVTELQIKEAAYVVQIEEKKQHIDDYLQQIDQLNKQLKATIVGTLGLIDEQDIAREFKKEYEYQDPSIKVRRFPIIDPLNGQILLNGKGEPVTEPYLSLPIDYVKEVIAKKIESETCREENNLRIKVAELEDEKSTLYNNILELKEEKAKVYISAYEEAYQSFNTIHKNYIELLNSPPKVDFTPNWLQIGLGVISGGLLCNL